VLWTIKDEIVVRSTIKTSALLVKKAEISLFSPQAYLQESYSEYVNWII